MHQELHALLEEDQADRRGELPAEALRRAEEMTCGDRPRPRRRGGRQGGDR